MFRSVGRECVVAEEYHQMQFYYGHALRAKHYPQAVGCFKRLYKKGYCACVVHELSAKSRANQIKVNLEQYAVSREKIETLCKLFPQGIIIVPRIVPGELY